jgi:UDP-glucose 4-epimerase
VYGHPLRVPITEDMPKNPINPYGRTTTMEWMMEGMGRRTTTR